VIYIVVGASVLTGIALGIVIGLVRLERISRR
jgi:hypothetical protein